MFSFIAFFKSFGSKHKRNFRLGFMTVRRVLTQSVGSYRLFLVLSFVLIQLLFLLLKQMVLFLGDVLLVLCLR